ncbi:MAG: hypothetical protein ACR2P0_06955 [Acidimicrobiales bacterium]
MSVDMHLKGKNLAPYRVVRQDDLKVHVAPNLMGYASSVELGVKGTVRKKIRVEINHEHGPHCNHG